MQNDRTYKVILSGGGTGGHIYPAVAVAQALKARLGDRVEVLFVGALGRMEMEKIPALGYRIEGLPVAGIQRKLSMSNFSLPVKIARSVRRARRIIRDFGADVVAGFGGYASGPVLWSAQRMGIPTIIQEQNSHAGLTNKILARGARQICVAYDGMQTYFPQQKIVMTGNPLRGSFSGTEVSRDEAAAHFGLDPRRAVIFVTGGSLGTRTLNEMVKRSVERFSDPTGPQLIWQTGKYYEPEIDAFMAGRNTPSIWRGAFIDRMDFAYAAADVVISRSGACTVSELCLVAKPVVFVPSPNVAEDHQTKNARALADKGAAVLVPDSRAVEEGIGTALAIAADPARKAELSAAIASLAINDSADRVAKLIIQYLENES